MAFVDHLYNKYSKNPLPAYIVGATAALVFFYNSSRCRAYVRFLLYAITIILCSTWGIIISLYYGIETNYHATLAFARVCEWTIGLKLEVEGAHHLESGPSVVIYNHQTSLDIVFIGRAMPRRSVVLAKKQLKWVPFFGQYLLFSRAVLVDRSNNKDAVASLHAAGEKLLAQKASLLVFPEGTRSLTRDCTMRSFKKGGFHVAIESGLPIVPVVFENQWNIWRDGVFNSGKCKIRVLPPIQTKGMTMSDAATLAVTSREIMLEALKEISSSEFLPSIRLAR